MTTSFSRAFSTLGRRLSFILPLALILGVFGALMALFAIVIIGAPSVIISKLAIFLSFNDLNLKGIKLHLNVVIIVFLLFGLNRGRNAIPSS